METVTKKNDDYSSYQKLAYWDMEDLVKILSSASKDTPEFIKKAIARALLVKYINTVPCCGKNPKDIVWIDPLSALKWAQDNEYHIPDGLIFHETDCGGLAWGEKPKAKATYKWITGEQLLGRWQEVNPTDIVTIAQEETYHTDDSGYNYTAQLLSPRKNPLDPESTWALTNAQFSLGAFAIEKEIKQLYFSMKEIYEAESEFPHLAEQSQKNNSIPESSMENLMSRDERNGVQQLRDKKQTENGHHHLTTPEKQELGRLRKEKAQLDEVLKAAVLIGHWIDTCKIRITKPQIQAILDNHFPDIDKKKTVLSQLWDSLPNNAKNTGSGNRNEPMPDSIWPDVNTEMKK